MKIAFRAIAAILTTTLAIAAGDTAALAQSAPKTLSAPPAESYAVAPGGVDLRTGTYTYKATDLTIGSGNEDSTLSLVRSLGFEVLGHDNPFANFSHNWDIMLTQKRININSGSVQPDSGVDYQASIHFGGRSQTFRAYANLLYITVDNYSWGKLTFSGTENNRANGTSTYTFTASDGTIVVFRPPGNKDCSSQMMCGYASSVTLPDGTRYVLSYENPTPGTPNTTRLKSVTSSRGYALIFDYVVGDWNRVSKACVINLAIEPVPGSGVCPASPAAVTTYTYGNVGGPRLTGVVDTSNKTWSFGYTGDGGTSISAMTFTKPGATLPWLTNTITTGFNIDNVPQEITGAQSFADGRSYTYGYQYAPQKPGEWPTVAGGTFVDNAGRSMTVNYDFPIMPGTGLDAPCPNINQCQPYNVPDDPGLELEQRQQTTGPAAIIDPLGRRTVNDYCDPYAAANYPSNYRYKCLVAVLQSTTDPEGGVTKYTWDIPDKVITQIRRIAKPGSGLPDIVTSASYDCAYRPACTKPISVTDAKGNVTTYTYDPVHGGMLTATLPAVKVNGTGSPIAPVTRYAYAQRYAWISNGSGGYGQAATPVWVLVGEKTCRATATVSGACAGGAADEVVTAYEYGPDSGPNNLLLRGVTVTADVGGAITTLRTCYTYDPKGRKISETRPRGTAGLTVCP